MIPQNSAIFVNVCEILASVLSKRLSYRCTMTMKGESSMIQVSIRRHIVFLIVFANVAIRLEVFEDPETFDPGRYINNEYGTKPGVDTSNFRANISFGSGRVSC